MTFSEKKLYHQIHPYKLSTDISASIITLFLFWYHYVLLGIILHYTLPIISSFLTIKYSNLEQQKRSALGKYIRKNMKRKEEAIRLIGDLITIFGAWYHQWTIISIGIIIILIGWFKGKIIKPIKYALIKKKNKR